MARCALTLLILLGFGCMIALPLGAQEEASEPEVQAETVPAPQPAGESSASAPAAMPENTPRVVDQLTLMMMVQHGGPILWVIMVLGFVAFVWSVFLMLTLTSRREVPPDLAKRAQAQLQSRDYRGAFQMCQERDELLANVLKAGLKMAGHGRYVIQEAMESEGERGATALWQRISYLNNIATLAPLLGLLGTVWGMMQAFGAIAFDTSQVKGLTMAYSVAEAMITTAAGLLLAIPTMAVYFFLRGRVIKIIASVEAQASEFVELISAGGQE